MCHSLRFASVTSFLHRRNFLLDLHHLLTLTPVVVLLGIPVGSLTTLATITMRLAALAHLASGSVEVGLAPRACLPKIAKHVMGILSKRCYVLTVKVQPFL